MALNKLPSLDKSRFSSKTETENTVKPDTNKISISSASSDDIKNKNKQPKIITIKKNKFTHT